MSPITTTLLLRVTKDGTTDLWRWAVRGQTVVLLRAVSTACRSNARRHPAIPTETRVLRAPLLWAATTTRRPSATRCPARPAVDRSSSNARRWPAGWHRRGSRGAPAFRARGTDVQAGWARAVGLQQRQQADQRWRRPAVDGKYSTASPSTASHWRRTVAA